MDEKKVETLGQTAVLADDYILIHKSIGSYKLQLTSHLNRQADPFHPKPSPRKTEPTQREHTSKFLFSSKT